MAQRTQVSLVDDLDGSEATQTATFAFQGTNYEMDLDDEHATSLEESLAEWIVAARKTTSRNAGGLVEHACVCPAGRAEPLRE